MRPIPNIFRKFSFFLALALSLNAALPAFALRVLEPEPGTPVHARLQAGLEEPNTTARTSSSDDVRIEPFTPNLLIDLRQAAQIASLLRQMYPEEAADIEDDEMLEWEVPYWMWQASFIVRRFQSDRKGEIIGLAVSAYRPEYPDAVYLSRLVVDKNWRKKKIGERLMQELFKKVREASPSLVRVVWHAAPDAQGFYEYLGAERVEEPGLLDKKDLICYQMVFPEKVVDFWRQHLRTLFTDPRTEEHEPVLIRAVATLWRQFQEEFPAGPLRDRVSEALLQELSRQSSEEFPSMVQDVVDELDRRNSGKPAAAQLETLAMQVQASAVGLEERILPSPQKPTTAPSADYWRDGWGVFPSVSERFHRMAVMPARGGPQQYLRVFASLKTGPLPKEFFEERVMGSALFDFLPTEGEETGYLRARAVPPNVGRRMERLIGWMGRFDSVGQGLTVRARVHLTPGSAAGDVAIPMKPVNVWKDGAIRFEGLVPADRQFEGIYPFTVEVFWQGRWYRLVEEGWIRIDPPNPAQVAAEASEWERKIGRDDAIHELRFARGYAHEVRNRAGSMQDGPEKKRLVEALELLDRENVVTDPVLPPEHRNPVLRGLVDARELTPAEAVLAFTAQQQEAGLQSGFFEGMQFKIGVLPGGKPVQIMYNPNRANTPPSPALREGDKRSHPLSDEGPLKVVVDGAVQVIKQRSLQVGFVTGLKNWLKRKLNPFGYVYGHATLPTMTQEPQEGWKEAVSAVVKEMWQQRDRLTVIGGNMGAKAAASIPDWAHLHDIPWRMPIDNPGDQDILWFYLHEGIRIGILRDPDMTTFVLEGTEDLKQQEQMILQADRLVNRLRDHGLAEYTIWGAVSNGTGRLFITPRNPAEPEPPADAAARAHWIPFDDYAKPIAAEDYWLVRLSQGQYELMSWGELETFGLENREDPAFGFKQAYDKTKPFIPRGRPIVDLKMGLMEIRRFVLVPVIGIYEDPYLEARLAKSYQVVGLARSHPSIHALVQELRDLQNQSERTLETEAVAEVEAVLAEIQRITTPKQLIRLFDRISHWRDREVQAFSRLQSQPQEGGSHVRVSFTQKAWELIQGFSAIPASTREETLSLIELVPTVLGEERPASNRPPLIGFTVNPTLDLAVEVKRRDDQTQYLRVRVSAGGSPANVVQASVAQGVADRLVATIGGSVGRTMVNSLRTEKIPVTSTPGPDTRISLMVISSLPGATPELCLVEPGGAIAPQVVHQAEALLREVRGQAVQLDKTTPPFALVAMGERFLTPAAVDTFLNQISETRDSGCLACVSANSSWDVQTWCGVLGRRPDLFVTSLEVLAGFLQQTDPTLQDRSLEDVVDYLRYRPEQLAARVDSLRRESKIPEWLIPFRNGSMVVLTDQKSWEVVSSPLLRLTYTSGTSDVVTASYLSGRLKGESAEQASRLAVTAGAVFMERTENERSQLPSPVEVSGILQRTQINELVRPLPPGIIREFNAFMESARRNFEFYHEQGLRELAGYPGGEQGIASGIASKFWNLQRFTSELLPQVLGHVVDGDYVEAAGWMEHGAMELLDAQRERIRTRASSGDVLHPSEVEYSFNLPPGQGEAYLRWLEELRQQVEVFQVRFKALAASGRPELDFLQLEKDSRSTGSTRWVRSPHKPAAAPAASVQPQETPTTDLASGETEVSFADLPEPARNRLTAGPQNRPAVLESIPKAFVDAKITHRFTVLPREEERVIGPQGQQIVYSVLFPDVDLRPRPVALILHGYAMNKDSTDIRGMAHEAALRGYLPVLVNFRNNGNQSAGSIKQFSFEGQVDDLAAVFADLSEHVPQADLQQVSFVGHSAGGLTGLSVTARRFQSDPRFEGIGIQRVVLISSVMDLPGWMLANFRQWVEERNMPRNPPEYPVNSGEDSLVAAKRAVGEWKDQGEAFGLHPGRSGTQRYWLEDGNRHWGPEDFLAALQAIPKNIPVVYIFGDQDPQILYPSETIGVEKVLFKGASVPSTILPFLQEIQARGTVEVVEKMGHICTPKFLPHVMEAAFAGVSINVSLEESALHQRFELLKEGRIERGVLVVPESVAHQTGLEEFLARLPADFASDVVLVGTGAAALQRRNPALKVYRGEDPLKDPINFAVYLAGLEDAERVGVLDGELAAVLKPWLASFKISVRAVSLNLSELFEALGTPASNQVGLEELLGEIFTGRGA